MLQRRSSLWVMALITVAVLGILLASCEGEPTGFQPGAESLPPPSEPFPSPTARPRAAPTLEPTPHADPRSDVRAYP